MLGEMHSCLATCIQKPLVSHHPLEPYTLHGGIVQSADLPSISITMSRQQQFDDNGQELNCSFRPAVATVICLVPGPLFHPDSAGMLSVTFTVMQRAGVCTFNGQY